MAFTHCVQLRLNRVGGIYDNGRQLSQLLREQVPLEAKTAINVEHTIKLFPGSDKRLAANDKPFL